MMANPSIDGRSPIKQRLRNTLFLDKSQQHLGGHRTQEQQEPYHQHTQWNKASGETYPSASRARMGSGLDFPAPGASAGSVETMSTSTLHTASGSDSSRDLHSSHSSQDLRHPSRSSFFDFDQPESVAKSLFAKGGRALRHHGSKLSLASSLSSDVDHGSGQVFWHLSGLGARVKRHRQGSASDRSKSCCHVPSDSCTKPQ